jgi:hypothetical protein
LLAIAKAIKNAKNYNKGEELVIAKNGAELNGGKKMWIHNRIVNIKKMLRNNKNFEDLGIVPADWTLVKMVNGAEKVLAYGVADYDIIEENGKTAVVYTNGKKVFKLTDREFDVEREVLFEAERCVRLAAR